MTADRRHRLDGLEPENLLAFMALLGLLRALDNARPAWRSRAYWDVRNPPLRPVLDLPNGRTRREIADAAAEGAAKLGEAHVFDRKDLNYSGDEAREVLLKLADSARSALFDALLSDGALKDDGRIWPTPLCFLFGQGHQHFLDRLSAVPTGRLPKTLEKTRKAPDLNDPQFIAATLFGPWTRSEATDSFRWDPIEDRRYALRARDPSGDPAGTQHGANRLAAIGLPAMSGTIILRHGGMRFLNRGTSYGTAGRIEISWPIWNEPARLTGLRALLARSEIAMETPDEQNLNAVGVIGLFRAERISVGKFFNVTPARRVF
jgi:hypothetical protein